MTGGCGGLVVVGWSKRWTDGHDGGRGTGMFLFLSIANGLGIKWVGVLVETGSSLSARYNFYWHNLFPSCSASKDL